MVDLNLSLWKTAGQVKSSLLEKFMISYKGYSSLLFNFKNVSDHNFLLLVKKQRNTHTQNVTSVLIKITEHSGSFNYVSLKFLKYM